MSTVRHYYFLQKHKKNNSFSILLTDIKKAPTQ